MAGRPRACAVRASTPLSLRSVVMYDDDDDDASHPGCDTEPPTHSIRFPSCFSPRAFAEAFKLDEEGVCRNEGTFQKLKNSRSPLPRSRSLSRTHLIRRRWGVDGRLLQYRTGVPDPARHDPTAVSELLPAFGHVEGTRQQGSSQVPPWGAPQRQQQQQPQQQLLRQQQQQQQQQQQLLQQHLLQQQQQRLLANPLQTLSGMPAHTQRLILAQSMLTQQQHHLQVMQQRHWQQVRGGKRGNRRPPPSERFFHCHTD